MNYLLGIDCSTTATKALLIDVRGQVCAVAIHEYGFDSPQPGWTEQDSELFWEGTVHTVRAVMALSGCKAEEILAVGLTGQMHGMCVLDQSGAVIRPVILWNDQRTSAECAWITAQIGRERVIALTGNPVLTGFTAPKLIWMRDHEPDAYRRIAKLLLPKDYVRYRLSGAFVTDMSDASGTSLLDVRRRTWSDEMLAGLGIPGAWMPDLVEGSQICAQVSPQAAAATGLLAGTPIVGGGGDQAAGAMGSGTVREGAVSCSLGTSGVVFAASDHYRADPQGRLHAFCHALPDTWHVMGVMLSAAGSLRWWRDTLLGALPDARLTYDALIAPCAAIPPGCEGLTFLPYLTGERTPYADPAARGAFVGLTVRHTLAHMTRAVLEGVAFGLCDSLELIRGLGLSTGPVVGSGGGMKGALWRQILADVFGAPIITLATTEGAALGAAVLGGLGAGVWPSAELACTDAIRTASVTAPLDGPQPYAAAYARYRGLYPALAPLANPG